MCVHLISRIKVSELEEGKMEPDLSSFSLSGPNAEKSLTGSLSRLKHQYEADVDHSFVHPNFLTAKSHLFIVRKHSQSQR